MDYCSQSTLLDVVNNYKNKGSSLEECLVIFFTVELLKALEALHSVGILHGDLKADNCMVRFEPINESDWVRDMTEVANLVGHIKVSP